MSDSNWGSIDMSVEDDDVPETPLDRKLLTIEVMPIYNWFKLRLLAGEDINNLYKECVKVYDYTCSDDGMMFDTGLHWRIVDLLDYVAGYCPSSMSLQQYTNTTLTISEEDEY